MKLHALAIAAALAAAATSAHAVFFFFLPLGAIQNAVQGGHCVPATAKAGDRIEIGGKPWVVKETNGVSSRCSQYPNWPVIAKLEPYVSPAELAAEMQVCLPMGASEGSRTTVAGIGEVYVRSVSTAAADCSDMRTPVSARVVRTQYADKPPAPQEPSKPSQTAPASVPQSALGTVGQTDASKTPPREELRTGETGEQPKLVPTVAAQPLKQKGIAERLRELKQLRDENLITESVYESKQREILSSQ